jgi:hypothetical protein
LPVESSKLNPPDPFFMNEDKVNECIASYLLSKGFKDVHSLRGNARGVDVSGKKGDVEVFVESKGSRPNDPEKMKLFDNNQLWDHLCNQICKLMVYRDGNINKKIILVAANPDIPRIRTLMDKISSSVDDLGITKMWVSKNGEIKVDIPKTIEEKVCDLLK